MDFQVIPSIVISMFGLYILQTQILSVGLVVKKDCLEFSIYDCNNLHVIKKDK